MKYPKRKDKYCSDVLNDNFREIDNRLVSLEKGGGGSGGVSNIEYLTQAAYDALPDTKLSNDVEYRITDSGTESVKASNVRYDNTHSMLEAVNVQGAVDELHNSLGGLRFGYDGDSNTYGYYGADGSLIPFRGGQSTLLAFANILNTASKTAMNATVAYYDDTVFDLENNVITFKKDVTAKVFMAVSGHNNVSKAYGKFYVNDVLTFNYSSTTTLFYEDTISFSVGDLCYATLANENANGKNSLIYLIYV